jgi:hypothetical protein
MNLGLSSSSGSNDTAGPLGPGFFWPAQGGCKKGSDRAGRRRQGQVGLPPIQLAGLPSLDGLSRGGLCGADHRDHAPIHLGYRSPYAGPMGNLCLQGLAFPDRFSVPGSDLSRRADLHLNAIMFFEFFRDLSKRHIGPKVSDGPLSQQGIAATLHLSRDNQGGQAGSTSPVTERLSVDFHLSKQVMPTQSFFYPGRRVQPG